MLIIQKYLFKEFFTYLGLVQGVVIALFVTIDYLTRIGYFMKLKIPLWYGLGYVLLKVPYILVMLMPACAILATIIVLCIMVKNNEILALKSSGVRSMSLLKPIMILGIGLMVFSFLLSETLVPVAQTKANSIRRQIKNMSVTTTRDNNIWIRKNDAIIHINYYNHIDKVLSGITLYYFDKNFKMTRRIDAQKAYFQQGRWKLQEILELTPGVGDQYFVSRTMNEKMVHFDLKPEDLKSVIKKPEEMNIKEMFRYVTKLNEEGYDPIVYRVDLHGKVAFPFACFLMCITGFGLVLSGRRKKGLPVSIAGGICISFVYWFFHSFCISMGYGELLPPVMAAWMANFVLACASGIILLNTD
jgi:lipopolysaccharide export system permease protein